MEVPFKPDAGKFSSSKAWLHQAKSSWDAGKHVSATRSAFSTVEVVVAVATMAMLSSVPMTTLQSLCMIFCNESLKQAHNLIAVHGASLGEVFPTGIMQFRALFCCWIAFSLLRFHQAQAHFYRWFNESDSSISQLRGFGYFTCRIFGLLRAPTLSQAQFHGSLFLMAACLVGAALPLDDANVTRGFLFVALVMYFLHFSQLFCESRAGGHSTIIIPLVLIHLLCADERGHWSILLLKLHIAFCYFSAGFGKLIVGIFFGKFWGSGKPLQYMFFEAMWSRPGGKISQAIQEFMFRRLWLNCLSANFALLFQISVPLALVDLRISWLFFLLSFSFHAGILVTTNISFMPYWVPALLIFVFPHGAAPYDGPYESAAFALNGAYEANPLGFSCICIYLLAQAIVTFGLVDLTYGDILPITCEPMFVLPRDLHDIWPKCFVFTSANCREAGHLEPYMHHCYNPFSKPYPMDEEAILNLPSNTLIFMTMKTIPAEVKDMLQLDVKPTPLKIWSNVPVNEEFNQTLCEIAEMLNDEDHPVFRNAELLDKLISLQRKCMSEFQSACLEEPMAVGFDSCTTMPLEKAL